MVGRANNSEVSFHYVDQFPPEFLLKITNSVLYAPRYPVSISVFLSRQLMTERQMSSKRYRQEAFCRRRGFQVTETSCAARAVLTNFEPPLKTKDRDATIERTKGRSPGRAGREGKGKERKEGGGRGVGTRGKGASRRTKATRQPP